MYDHREMLELLEKLMDTTDSRRRDRVEEWHDYTEELEKETVKFGNLARDIYNTYDDIQRLTSLLRSSIVKEYNRTQKNCCKGDKE